MQIIIHTIFILISLTCTYSINITINSNIKDYLLRKGDEK